MTDTLTKHFATPLPWEADAGYVVGRVKGGRPNGETIFAPYRREMSEEERLANALLVAEAVNDHAALERVVDAARAVRDAADPMGGVRRGAIRFDDAGDSSNEIVLADRAAGGRMLMANANKVQALHDALVALDTQFSKSSLGDVKE